LTMYTSVNPTRITCNEHAKVRNILSNMIHRRSYNVHCSGRWWRTGICGHWTEICAGCSRICTCNSGVSIRPCIGNNNWGGHGQTCSSSPQVLFMNAKNNAWQHQFYGVHMKSTYDNRCHTWKNKVRSQNPNVNAPLTMWSSRDNKRYTCTNYGIVNSLMYGLKHNHRRNHHCAGHWWRTGGCGHWAEICVGCASICNCNSGFSFRPCIGNSNWGGSWGHTCGAHNQNLYFKIGKEKKTTTTTSTTTTTTTTLVPLKLYTWMMPEKSSWKITQMNGKLVCKGGGYTQWYSSMSVNCKLVYKRRYKITCMNSWLGGWAGGYFSVRNNKLCKKYTFNRGPSRTETFVAK